MTLSAYQTANRVIFSVLLVSLMGGCRDVPPPDQHAGDLGTDGSPLLPTSASWTDKKVKDGQAEWVPFRKPAEEPEQSADADPGTGDVGNVKDEIRQLVEDYNAVAAERDIEELLTYHLESQQENAKTALEVTFQLTDKLREIREKLETKLPDKQDDIAAVFDPFATQMASMLSAANLTVVDETEVLAQPSSNSPGQTVRFVLVDDEWFVDMPNLANFAQVKPLIEGQLSTLDKFLQELAGSQQPAEQVFDGVRAAIATMSGKNQTNEGRDNTAKSGDSD